MSIVTIEEKVYAVLREIQKIKRTGRPRSNDREIDIIKNRIVQKLTNGELRPEYITIHRLMDSGLLQREAEEIYFYLKNVGLL